MSWQLLVVFEIGLGAAWECNHQFYSRVYRTKTDSKLIEYYQQNRQTSFLLILLADLLATYDVFGLKGSQPELVTISAALAVLFLTAISIILFMEMAQRGFRKNKPDGFPPSEKM